MRWKWTIIWGITGIVMLLSSLKVEWFDIDFTYFKLNLGWIVLLYTALLVWKNLLVGSELKLTQREMHDFGDDLLASNEMIMKMLLDKKKVIEIAQYLEETKGIPKLTAAKYIILLLQTMKKESSKARSKYSRSK